MNAQDIRDPKVSSLLGELIHCGYRPYSANSNLCPCIFLAVETLDIAWLSSGMRLSMWDKKLVVFFNSLALARCDSTFKSIIFMLIIQNSRSGTGCEIALRCMSQNLTNEKSTFVQVMANVHSVMYHYMVSLGHNGLTHGGMKSNFADHIFKYI